MAAFLSGSGIDEVAILFCLLAEGPIGLVWAGTTSYGDPEKDWFSRVPEGVPEAAKS